MSRKEKNLNDVQLTLLDYKPSVDELRNEVKTMHERQESVRKSLYARNAMLEKKYTDLELEFAYFKAALCKS